jgi:hypothetical protein
MERVEFSGVGSWWVSRPYARCLILSGKEHACATRGAYMGGMFYYHTK